MAGEADREAGNHAVSAADGVPRRDLRGFAVEDALVAGEEGTFGTQGEHNIGDAALMQLLRCSVGVVALIIGAMIIRIITPSMLTAGISSFLGLLFLAGSLLVRDLPFSLTEAALILMVISVLILKRQYRHIKRKMD